MQVETNQGTKLNGFYRGTVLKRVSHGKCKVFIYGVYPESFKENPLMLPDCEQASPLWGGINNGKGMYSYPNIGSTVWCFFQNGDQNYPVYFASSLGTTKGASQFKSCEAFQDKDDGAYIHKICCGQSTITMSEVGNVIIENHSMDVKTNKPLDTVIIMNQGGDIQINSTKTLQINTESLKLKASKTIQIETDELAVKANMRSVHKSPYTTFETNYTGVDEVNNAFTVKSGRINLNTDLKGEIFTSTKTNGVKSL